MLERVRNKSRCMPMHRGLCTCLVDNDGTTIVENNMNTLQCVMCCAETTKPSVHFVLTTCQSSVNGIPDDGNALSMLMKAQRDANNSTSLRSFHKKVNAGTENATVSFVIVMK